MSRFNEYFHAPKAIIGLSHLPPLPDYPDSPGIAELRAHALRDLAVLQNLRFDGILIENEYDRPHRVLAEPETVSAITEITTAVAEEAETVLVGCEILLNDPRASLDAAKASGASFIRTDYFIDRMSRPQYGEFEIDAEGLIKYREEIAATDVLILADIQVKYATMIVPRTLLESARLACLHGADAIVVTGDETGDAPTIEQLRDARTAARGYDIPVLIGSGLDADNAMQLLSECDGAIVGTALMRNRKVDTASAQRLMIEVEKTR